MYFIGYDIGSDAVKAALYDASSNQVLGLLQHPQGEMEIISHQPGWAEQQPEVWWMHFCMATRKLLSETGISPNDISGIGLAYQMHGLVLVDANLQSLRPAIIWRDSRSVGIGDQAFHELGEAYCLENFLNSPGNFTASKLKWVKDHEPETYSKIYKVLLPGDYIALKLSGEAQTTLSGLSEGIFWNFNKKDLAYELLDFYGLDKHLLPDRVPTFSIQGRVNKEGAEFTGLAEGTPISYRAGDQPNNAMTYNVMNPGEVSATSGSSGVVYGIVDKPTIDSQSRINAFAHVNYELAYDRIGILLCINGAGDLYSWMKHQVAQRGTPYQDMERLASALPIGSNGLCILPFGNGAERMLGNKNTDAHIHHLRLNQHGRAHMFRAALEGVAFAFGYGVNLLKEMGLTVGVLRVGNDNMFQSPIFSETLATLLDCEIEVVDSTGAIGAARAAGVGTGHYSLDTALAGIHPRTIYAPVAEQGAYLQAYSHWVSCLHQHTQPHPHREQVPASLKGRYEKASRDLIQKDKEIALNSLKLASLKELLADTKMLFQQQNTRTSEKVRELLDKIDHQLAEEGDLRVFESYFEILNGAFFQQLKSLHPTLSPAELRLCSFIRMNLSNKEIADQLTISVRGVETRRYRLRKKFDLPAYTNLANYLESLDG